ncbi:MAG TPA: glycosyltransferase family 39 protein [Candidatus Eremiobacteraceae bacterium]|nr:glycosyltransferase family 39 protein [Candidatus Eremiobacteraceae bacterium]
MPRSRLAWALLGLAALLRAALALLRPLQVDEAYSLHVAALPLQQGLQILRSLDVHPPLFLYLLHGWLALHSSDGAIRLRMVVFGVASVWLLYAIVLRWHGPRAAVVAMLCASAMPSLIFYDSMIRMYAPFDTLALLSFLLLSILLTRSDLSVAGRRALWVGWVLVSALSWYTLYLGFFITLAQLLYVALLRRDALPRALLGTACAAVAFAPQWSTLAYQLPRGGLAFPFYAQHQLQALLELAGQATIAVQMHGNDVLAIAAGVLAWGWMAAALALAAPGNRASLALWLGAPAALTLAYGVLAHKLLYADRYYLLLAYALCAWTGVAVDRLAQRIPARATRPAALLAAGVLLGIAVLYVFNPVLYTANWPGVAALLRTRSQPNDLIVFDQGSPFFVLERGTSLGRHPLLVVLRRSDVAGSIRLSQTFNRVWLVLFQSGPVDPDNALFSALRARRTVAGVWSYPRALPAENVEVILFER